MAAFTPTQAQQQLDAYLAAETAVLTGQEYTIAGRKLVRADLAAIQAGIKLWSERLDELQRQASGTSRFARMRPGF